ncbi:hypothetical protein [Paenibacillus sp. S150]|uniref:hypothetical protein n=1 Tax=Paenibacillus sp. S150 TaxID=2749826 RepID=UPI001C575FAB|nr:hypothetical protein [Paenibacillus sp. S150]MBW4085484.1 hypothetical protein [Paenibacillus sp. S150]
MAASMFNLDTIRKAAKTYKSTTGSSPTITGAVSAKPTSNITLPQVAITAASNVRKRKQEEKDKEGTKHHSSSDKKYHTGF